MQCPDQLTYNTMRLDKDEQMIKNQDTISGMCQPQ
ncbi:hypothetical protein SLEP1_g28041 [Rubroshorea leprosula]|uniref:Uncharacterized protein n=1 Tax=Rubroshorea leprosula TaxID=152421 RepID=A0AAV5JYU2_9ROSI|nr:hypothetical protein SLEP1_g28041 [Rubroshorea leprosula]